MRVSFLLKQTKNRKREIGKFLIEKFNFFIDFVSKFDWLFQNFGSRKSFLNKYICNNMIKEAMHRLLRPNSSLTSAELLNTHTQRIDTFVSDRNVVT